MKRPVTGSENGMTLVEVLVAGVIGLIPATLIGVLYLMYNGQLRENNAHLLLQRQYETVAQEVARSARRAHRIRSTAICSEPCVSAADTGSAVYFFDRDSCPPFAGIMIQGDSLMELRNGAPVAFTAGNAVLVDSANCRFILPGCGNRITLHLRLKTVDNDTFHLEPPESVYRCRN